MSVARPTVIPHCFECTHCLKQNGLYQAKSQFEAVFTITNQVTRNCGMESTTNPDQRCEFEDWEKHFERRQIVVYESPKETQVALQAGLQAE